MSPAEPTENAQAQQQNNQQLYPQRVRLQAGPALGY